MAVELADVLRAMAEEFAEAGHRASARVGQLLAGAATPESAAREQGTGEASLDVAVRLHALLADTHTTQPPRSDDLDDGPGALRQGLDVLIACLDAERTRMGAVFGRLARQPDDMRNAVEAIRVDAGIEVFQEVVDRLRAVSHSTLLTWAADLVGKPRAAWEAVVGLEARGIPEQASELTAAITAAGGRVPDGTEFVPDDPRGLIAHGGSPT